MIGLLTQFMQRLRLLTLRRCQKVFVLVILLIGLSMSSCSSLKSINAKTDVSCELFKPITWSDKDSKNTLEQVFAHNITWDAVCQ
jgi:hypothetical protein